MGHQRVVRYLAGFGTGVRFGVHNNNLTNLLRGVVERVLYVSADGALRRPPSPKAKVFYRLSSIAGRLVRAMPPTTVVARQDYPGLYNGRKRGVYQRALESLSQRPLTRKDSYVSTFVKAEKINFSAKGDPAPRVIQPRSPRYNLEVGRYLKLFEPCLGRAFERVFGHKVILKGLNADGVASAMYNNWQQFNSPAAVGLDASRFDQHVSVDALRFEHGVYNSVFKSPELRELLEWQLHNVGFGRVGDSLVRYKVDGCRMSGDINTGMGNCLIMSCIVIGYLESRGIKWRLANNGDDCVVFCERSDLPQLAGIADWFLDFGFKLTQERPVFVLEEVEFCQAHPVLLSTGWRMVRNPFTAMSKDCVSLLGWATEAEFETWRDAIGTCGRELTTGVPVWESFYRAVQVGSRRGGLEAIYDSGLGYMARGVRAARITPESRHSFWRAFGIDPDQQVALESSWPTICWGEPLALVFTDTAQQSPLQWLSPSNLAATSAHKIWL